MICLVPLDTSVPQNPTNTMPFASSYTLSQNLPANALSATFDLSAYSFSVPPSNVIPTIVRADGTKPGIKATPRQATTTSFTCDLDSPTTDATYVCTIEVFP